MAKKKKSGLPKEYVYRFDVWVSLNDRLGVKIAPSEFLELEEQLYGKFKGLTCTPIVGNPIYEGYWEDEDTGRKMRDMNVIYTVLAPRTPDSYEFFSENKPRWTAQFNQKSVLITVYQVETV
jgi:hypothetical protein